MVEGHQVHRVAHAHRRLLVGHRFLASSPNGRFTEGAAALDRRVLTRVEAVGKNLFYIFMPAPPSPSPPSPPPPSLPSPSFSFSGRRPSSSDEAAEWALASVPADAVVARVHFGMSGMFPVFSRDKAPPPKPTTRLRLEGLPGTPAEPIVAHLSAMTLQHGSGGALFADTVRTLGPDPLRDDADEGRFYSSLERAPPKKPVGLMLMQQQVIAGAGNIYRAEILFKSRVHPEQPAATLPRSAAERIWRHSVDLLRRGAQSGSILTVDREDAERLGKPWTRRYLYNMATCGECKGRVASWDMAGRTCYACPRCQPLVGPGEDPLERSFAEAARRARVAVGAGGGKNDKGKAGAGAAGGAAVAPCSSVSESGAAAAVTAAAAENLAPARRAALAAAAPVQPFNSHCAPDRDAADVARAAAAAGAGAEALRPLLQKLTAPRLRELLAELLVAAERGVSASALASTKKAALVKRLAEAMVASSSSAAAAAASMAAAVIPTPDRFASAQQRRRRPRGGRSGSAAAEAADEGDSSSSSSGSEDGVDRADAALARANVAPPALLSLLARPTSGGEKGGRWEEGRVASAREAALEKARAGEHRAVEHVALGVDDDDGVLEAIERGRATTAKRQAKKRAQR